MLQEPIKAMRWLQKIMKCRIEFVEQNINQALIGTHNSICTEALTKLEVCLIMFQSLTLLTPCTLKSCIEEKINLNFYFHTSF